MNTYICLRCGASYPINENHWLCDCGAVLELEPTSKLDPNQVQTAELSLWRYSQTLPVDDPKNIVTMGEGWTPLVPLERDDDSLMVKLEYANPTGSYKDRGASVLVSKLLEAGVREVVEDSSGNAGAALAAYSARAGIRCHIYVPASHSAGKMKQILAYGADLVQVIGSRRDTALAAIEAGKSSYYASHAHSPFFVEGCKTLAYELWEQTDGNLPGMVITPLGQGSILLGLYKGFQELLDLGLSDRLPRLIGVQAEACAPVVDAFNLGSKEPVAIEQVGETIAEGIKIADPVRGASLLTAIYKTGGAAVAVSENEIAQAKIDLARNGFYVEPTSAVTLAGYRRISVGQRVEAGAVLLLTGSGLKSSS